MSIGRGAAALLTLVLVVSACDGGGEPPASTGEPSPAPDRPAQARRHAPMIWLAAAERNGPMDASRFVAESGLWFASSCGRGPARTRIAEDVDERKLGGRDEAYTARDCGPDGRTYASGTDMKAAHGAGFYLNAADGDGPRRGDGPTAPVYWEFHDRKDGHHTAYVYWLFYGYNDYVNNHEGDWERVAVQLVDGAPDGVIFWKHHDAPCRVPWPDIGKSEGHPVTYSARGSHGSYPFAGGYDAFPFGPGSAQPVTDVTTAGTRWETWNTARSLVDAPWWGYRGLWGDQTGAEGANGPRGPYPGRSEVVFTETPCEKPLPGPSASPGPTVPRPTADTGIPDAWRGLWTARAPMTRPGLEKPHYVRLILWDENDPGAGDTEGTSEYSSDFSGIGGEVSCSGDLRLVEAGPDRVVLTETERSDAYGNCPYPGRITITRSGDVLNYAYSGGGGTATATLTRG